MDEQFDVLIIGAGVAGLTAALEAASSARVLVISKGRVEESNTYKAQGGIAAVLRADDSFDLHISDTLAAGAGLCDVEIVSSCVREAPERIKWLASLGTKFQRTESPPSRKKQKSSRAGRTCIDRGPGKDASCDSERGEYDLGLEGGHSRRRIVHAGDVTGRHVEEVLYRAALEHPNVTIWEGMLAVDLITLGKLEGRELRDRCIGCYVMDKKTGNIGTIGAGATILATGGAGKVYLYTSNPDQATGDGVAMAWRAGATIANMEFFQFHPTCLYHPLAKNFLITESLRGEGGILTTRSGDRFMPRYHKAAELAPRDIVARAIDEELKKTGDDFVLLDISGRDKGFIKKRFPGVYSTCLKFGLDITKEPIPVVPAAHYQCGGVAVDRNGWTGIEGLYAVGEVACTGMHGANRLASNSLLEALVFGKRAGITALKWLRQVPQGPSTLPAWHTGMARHPDESVVISQNWHEIRTFMWNYVGLVRSDNRLNRARKRLSTIREEVLADYWRFILTPDLVELRNLSDVAYVILESAAVRKESRGLHYNLDHPQRDDANWKRPTLLKRSPRER